MELFRKILLIISGLILASVFFASSNDEQAGRLAFWILYNIAAIFIFIITVGIKGIFEEFKNDHLQDPAEFWWEQIEYYKRDRIAMNPYRKNIMMPSPYHPCYRGDMTAWNYKGYWQAQWRSYINGDPCVYNDPNILPKGHFWLNPEQMKFEFYHPALGKIVAEKN